MRLWCALLFSLLLTACATAPSAARIFNASRLEPEAWYQVLYLHVRSCAEGLGKASSVSYDDIEWYVVAAGELGERGRAPAGDGHFAGVSSPPNRIYLDERYVVDIAVLAHELGHIILTVPDNLHDAVAFASCTEIAQ